MPFNFDDIADGAKDLYEGAKDALGFDKADPNGGSVVQNAGQQIGIAAKRFAADSAAPQAGRPSSIGLLGVPLQYPIQLLSVGSQDNGPYIEITGFAYYRLDDSNDNRTSPTFNTNFGFSIESVNNIEVKYVICLPLPGNLQSGLSSSFSDTPRMMNAAIDFASRTNKETVSADVQEMIDSVINPTAGASLGTLAAGVGGAIIGANNNGRSGIIGGAVGAVQAQASLNYGLGLNPMAEATYSGTGMRSHSFDFTMVPRNLAEADSINSIIQTLQDGAIGEAALQSTNLILKYPNLHEVRFMSANGEPIPGILQIPDSFLDSINVVYNPIGAGRLMDDDRPTSYRVSLNFKESKALTQQDVKALRQQPSFNKYTTVDLIGDDAGGFFDTIKNMFGIGN